MGVRGEGGGFAAGGKGGERALGARIPWHRVAVASCDATQLGLLSLASIMLASTFVHLSTASLFPACVLRASPFMAARGSLRALAPLRQIRKSHRRRRRRSPGRNRREGRR